MCYLGHDLAIPLPRNDEPPGMFGKAFGQTPFLCSALSPTRGPAQRLTVGWHNCELKRQDTLQGWLLSRAHCEELLGTGREHAADIDRFTGQPKHRLAALDHSRPHVGQQVRQERQRAWLTCCGIDDSVWKPLVFERNAERFRRAGYNIAELRACERGDIDVLEHRIKGLVALQPIKIIRSQTSESE